MRGGMKLSSEPKQGGDSKKSVQGHIRFTSIAILAIVVLSAVGLKTTDTWLFGDEETSSTELGALCMMIGYFCVYYKVTDFKKWMSKIQAKKKKAPKARQPPKDGAINEPPAVWQKRQKYNSDMDLLAKDGKADEAEELIKTMSDDGIVPCATTYLHMVLACIRTKDVERAEHFSQSLLNPGVGLGAGPGFAHQVIEACLKELDADQAVKWFHVFLSNGGKPAGRTFVAVVEGICKKEEKGNAALAERFFEETRAKGYEMDASCWQAMLDTCVSGKDLKKTEALFIRMLRAGHAATNACWIAMIRACAHKRDVNRAEMWLKKMIEQAQKKDLTVETACFNAVIHACSRAGDADRAEMWLMKMNICTLKGNGPSGLLRPDVVSFSTILDACAEAGDIDRAEKWFGRMAEAGLKPDSVSYNTMMKVHSKCGTLNSTIKWLYAAKEAGEADTFGYNAVIASAARTGKPEVAESWLGTMAEHGQMPDKVSYNSVINAWAKKGNARRAQELLVEMRAKDIQPDVVSLGAAIHACAQAVDAKTAQAILDSELSQGTKLDTVSYNALIDVFVKAGDITSAELWLQRMCDSGIAPGVVTYTTVLHAHAKNGDIDAAEMCIQRMLSNGVQANVVTYTAMIRACAQSASLACAETWFGRMIEAGVKPNSVTYCAILNVCAKSLQAARAEYWLHHMTSQGVERNTICYNCVIDACSKVGEPERAEGWLRVLKQSGLTCTPPTYTTTAQAFANKGDANSTERILMEMEEDGLPVDTYCLTVLLSGYAKARPRLHDRAVEVFRLYASKGVQITKPATRALRGLIGQERTQALCDELGLVVANEPEKKPQHRVVFKGTLEEQAMGRGKKETRPAVDIPGKKDTRVRSF